MGEGRGHLVGVHGAATHAALEWQDEWIRAYAFETRSASSLTASRLDGLTPAAMCCLGPRGAVCSQPSPHTPDLPPPHGSPCSAQHNQTLQAVNHTEPEKVLDLSV